MSQSPGRFSAPVNLATGGRSSSTPLTPANNCPPSSSNDKPLPSYLSRHIQLGFTQDDVAALISSIDSSQAPPSSSNHTLAHLPAELLLQILEHVPVDHVLDWRLVCRGFRDAIDGRILYHCLQRTELVGYMGGRHERVMEDLDDDEYEDVHLLKAGFVRVEGRASGVQEEQEQGRRPIWSYTHAVFKIADQWYRAFETIGGAEAKNGHAILDADEYWGGVLDRLELQREEEGFGTLRWCIRLDHAVLDLDFPCEKDHMHFDFNVSLETGYIRVAWKDMLVRFLKTERALRLLMEEKRFATFTFSHQEDCLRHVRRTRLIASLTPSKEDNAIRWALRLLRPLYNAPADRHSTPLADIESDATRLLLLLRRTASLSATQLTYLHHLRSSYLALEADLRALDASYTEFKTYMSMPGFQTSLLVPARITNVKSLPRNPVAWDDELRLRVEAQVARWKAQGSIMQTVRGLLEGSCEAMALPEDGFDELGSDF